MSFVCGFIIGVVAAFLGVYLLDQFTASIFDDLEKPPPAGSLY